MATITDSILDSVKKRIGPSAEYDYYDPDIIMDINSTFMILNQMGIGPEKPFSISDRMDTWDDFMPEGEIPELVKTYIYMKVKLMFDPPLSSSVATAMNEQIKEMEWRLNVAVDPGKTEEEPAVEENQNETED